MRDFWILLWPQEYWDASFKSDGIFNKKNKIQKSRGCAIFEFCFGLRNTGTLLLLVTTFLIKKNKIKGSFWADYGMNPCWPRDELGLTRGWIWRLRRVILGWPQDESVPTTGWIGADLRMNLSSPGGHSGGHSGLTAGWIRVAPGASGGSFLCTLGIFLNFAILQFWDLTPYPMDLVCDYSQKGHWGAKNRGYVRRLL